jgi:hypothetical protein
VTEQFHLARGAQTFAAKDEKHLLAKFIRPAMKGA